MGWFPVKPDYSVPVAVGDPSQVDGSVLKQVLEFVKVGV